MRRWWYIILTFRDHAKMINRRVEVENELLEAYKGKRELTREDFKRLAFKLGK